jgi:predicted DNA-binding protein (MmcQ/YjbR family)
MLSGDSSRYRGNNQPGLEEAPRQGPIARRNCYDARMLSEDAILQKLRKICLRLPAATEGVSFGHPTFRVANKIFAVLEEYKGELGICLKVGKLLQGVFLNDSRFFRTPYIGKHGWVTLRAYAAPLNWNEIRELVKCSYDLVAPARSLPRTKKKRKG